LPPSLSLVIPLDEVAAIGKRGLIVAAGALSRNGAKPPAPGDIDLFEDVDVRHGTILQLFLKMDKIMDSLAVIC
jgi:hypothetical protein